MRHLMLLRHAKSSWDQVGLEDIDRPLSPRGRSAAPLLGRYISRKYRYPDLVLCSSAVRAYQTWELVSAEWDQADKPASPVVEIRTSLYLANPIDLQSTIKRIGDDVKTAMIIGHNPGMEQLAARLTHKGDPRDLKLMAKKFPTAALAIIQLSIESWSSLRTGQGRLEAFVRPKDLLGSMASTPSSAMS